MSQTFTSRTRLRHQPAPIRLHHRAFSSTPPRPASSSLAHLTSRSLVKISGPDAAKFLQGVVTSNLFTSPGPNGTLRNDVPGFYSAFLTAQGRILHDVFIYLRSGEEFLIEVDAAEAERLAKHIKRYKLRAKFEVRVLGVDEGKIWHLWGSGVGDGGVVASLPGKGVIALQDPRAPDLGTRIVALDDPAFDGGEVGEVVPERDYTVHRYLLGVPEGQQELLYGASLPHESNMDVGGAIDFRKGCYVGQELTIRTEHRGVVRKRVLPCVVYPEDGKAPERLEYTPEGEAERIASGAAMMKIGGDGGEGVRKRSKEAGKWLKGTGNLGLAVVRLEEAGVLDAGEGKEFAIDIGGEGEKAEGAGLKMKVKPFMPEWLKEQLEAKNHRLGKVEQ